MSNKPATLIPESAVPILEEKAIIRASFEQLTGVAHPWEINIRKFNEIRKKLYRVERELRDNNPTREVTCIIGERGMYWLFEDAYEAYRETIEEAVKELKDGGPMPVWRYTTTEMLEAHVGNMRQLIMAVAHDAVLLDMLKDSLGDNHVMLNREFENTERNVRAMLDDIRDQGEFLLSSVSHDLLMVERCRITREMIERGVVSEEQLGYSAEELRRVEDVLDERCKKDLPAYEKRLAAIYSRMKDEMRKSESTQLVRSSRWVLAYSLLGEAPQGFRGQAEVASKEHETLSTVVKSREEELGESDEGKKALATAEEAVRAKEPPPPPEPKEESKEEPVEEPKKKKKITRMAFSSRKK